MYVDMTTIQDSMNGFHIEEKVLEETTYYEIPEYPIIEELND